MLDPTPAQTHADEAARILERSAAVESTPLMLNGLIEATLALYEEQKTANAIAYLALHDPGKVRGIYARRDLFTLDRRMQIGLGLSAEEMRASRS